MSIVALLCGPRGAGKTTHCKKIVAEYPDIQHMSLDDTMTRVFGYPWPDTDTGAWSVAYDVMMDDIKSAILANPSAIILADMWNGSCIDREKLIEKFLKMGADRVVIWYLTTPVDTARHWFLAREYGYDDRGTPTKAWQWKMHSYELDHHRYYERAHDLCANAISVRNPHWHVSWAPIIDVPVAIIDPTQLILPNTPLPTPFL
jgi:predicted kinase